MPSPRITVLPPDLADQIAAGEVIERPASVVKELVENALDAEARRIEVEIEHGGLSLVRVLDDGCGMTPEEAHLSLKRHATSKLHGIGDLFTLRTMGFRGEALPSIAAVSRLTLTTRTAADIAAYRLSVEASQETGARATGAPVGTLIEVRDLLFNVPARLKFLKGEATETGQISEALLRLSLAHPAVHFRLRNNGRNVLDLPPHGTALERAQAALTSRGRGAEPVRLYRASGSTDGVSVDAYLGAPEDSASTPRGSYLYVNRRFIRDRSLLHALGMGYGEVLERGRYPLAVLHVELPGDAVDINVHPQKLEVRFRDAQAVYKAVRHAVRATVDQSPWLMARPEAPPSRHQTVAVPLFFGTPPAAPAPAPEARPDEAAEARPSYGPPAPAPAGAGLAEHSARLQRALNLSQATESSAPRHEFFSNMVYLGQLNRTYLLCEHEKELVLIDQHAAHESLAFLRLQRAYRGEGLRAQRLLFPLSLELDPEAAALATDEAAALVRLGFELRPFGGRSFALTTTPDTVEYGRGARVHQDPERVLRKVLDDLLAHGSSEVIAAREERLLATVACHSVVRAGDVLDEMKARALLYSMDEEAFVPHCPHGRPVLVRLPVTEIEKRFGRS